MGIVAAVAKVFALVIAIAAALAAALIVLPAVSPKMALAAIVASEKSALIAAAAVVAPHRWRSSVSPAAARAVRAGGRPSRWRRSAFASRRAGAQPGQGARGVVDRRHLQAPIDREGPGQPTRPSTTRR
jgi:hypothetical protein